MINMYEYLDENGNGVANLPSSYSLVRHQHTQTVRYECSRCDSLFTSRKFLHEHEASMHNRIFHCPFCPSLFSNKPDYRTHINAHVVEHLPCAVCGKVFRHRAEYSAHFKTHMEQTAFRCDKCPASFNQLSMLRVHNSTHVQKKFVHYVPEISQNSSNTSSKKLLRQVQKELEFIQKITRTEKQGQADLQIVDVADEVDSANSNQEDDTHLTSDSIPTDRISASDACVPTAAKKIRLSQSAKKPIPQEKNVSKPKPTRRETVVESDDDISTPLTMNSGRYLRPRIRTADFYCEEFVDSDDDIVASLRNNYSNGEDSSSSAEVNSNRNLRPRNTVKNLNRGVDDIKSKVNHNLRPRVKRKNVYDEPLLADPSIPTDRTSASDACVSTSAKKIRASQSAKKPIPKRKNVSKPKSTRQESNRETEKPTSSRMCLSCKRIFLTYDLLNQHKELHILNKGIRCDTCGGLFGNPGSLAKHQMSVLQCST